MKVRGDVKVWKIATAAPESAMVAIAKQRQRQQRQRGRAAAPAAYATSDGTAAAIATANIRHPRSPKERNWLFEEAKISHALTNISPALTNILGRLLKKDMGCAEDLGAFSDRLRDKNAITTHGVTTALERQTIMSLGFIFYTVKMER